ncbi:ATP-dependent endonuclease [Vibrio sp. 10N.286.49.B3]|uniref:ATP-dependent endonuclease n=1 Tax=Vibrio sp. 10N.286.49.B3 TaxID=1880855 RepID=UPI000C84CBB5|nr:ATP-dependent endonuclease [Vibrio sp. 10N.286.49.B3]PMH41401.1 ATP-dependent endonuclease [Vibrio sp. 10N.286.49.B3]
MLLDRIDIAGFRGIKRLSLSFDQLTSLIGENTWGKSSLLDALSVVLPADGILYLFEVQDFHVDYSVSHPQTQHLQIVLRFKANDRSEVRSGRYRKLKPVWVYDEDRCPYIYYRISASRTDTHVTTRYSFLAMDGEPLQIHHPEKLAQELMTLNPVLRLKDSRRFQRSIQPSTAHKESQAHHALSVPTASTTAKDNQQKRIEKRIDNTCRRLLATPGHVNKGEMRSSLNAMQDLVDHYFSFKDHTRKNPREPHDGLFYSHSANDPTLSQLIKETNNKQTRLLLMGLLNAYLQAKGPTDLCRYARPILIIEDPEGRLHPTHLARAWSLLQLLPMQKILTTNSGAMLGSVPLPSIRRLVRQSDKTIATQLNSDAFTSDELRRIGFHIRFHRSDALFARCWLLVEGETEVWLFNELANQCGYNLAAEGVQIIEFAQSGLKGLIKAAKAFGIDWHVVTDGDMAGKKYAQTAKNQLYGDQEKHRLTELPSKDVELYLYTHGFERFFRDLVSIPYDQPIPAKKVIIRVLKKYAKPDLALAIMNHCQQEGNESIPLLLRWTLKRVITMANGNT